MELDTTMRMILQVPIWAQRVIYIQGSCLKDGDLARARMNEAEACFVLAARNYADKTAAVSSCIRRDLNFLAPEIKMFNFCFFSRTNTRYSDHGRLKISHPRYRNTFKYLDRKIKSTLNLPSTSCAKTNLNMLY